jgi:hypothetical protein
MSTNKLKDFWGNEALDYGSIYELSEKYSDNIFVFVSAKPFGDGYVLFLCGEDEEPAAYEWLTKYDYTMQRKGVELYGAGVAWGNGVAGRKAEGFIGGIGL